MMRILNVLIFCVLPFFVQGAVTNYYSGSTGNLDNLNSWWTNSNGTGSHPANFTSSNRVYNIVNNPTPTIGANWTVSGGGATTIVLGNGTDPVNFTIPAGFTLNGDIDISANATLTITNTTPPNFGTISASSTVIYNKSTGGQTVGGATYGTLKLENTSGTQTADGTITVNGALVTTSGGVFSMSNNQLLGTMTSVTNNGTISTANTSNPAIPSGKNWSGTTGLVIFATSSGSQEIPSGTYKGLTFSNTSGTNTAVGTITVNGDFTTTSGGTLAMTTFQLAGTPTSVTHNGTLTTTCTVNPAIPAGKDWSGTGGVSLVTFAATAGGQSIPAGTYKGLKISNTSNTTTAVGALTVNGDLTTTSGGTLDMGAFQLNGSPTSITHNGIISTTCTLNPAIPSGQTWSGSVGLVTFASTTGNQYIPTGTYRALTCSNTSDTNTVVGGDLTVTNGLTISAAGGALDMGTNAFTATTITMSETGKLLTQSLSSTPVPTGKTFAGTVIYNAATGGQTIMAGTYRNLTLGNSSGVNTASGNLIVNATLTTVSGGTLDLNSRTLSGTALAPTGGGVIQTANTSTTPIPSGLTWTQTIEYNRAAGSQTIVSGTYSGGLTNSNTSSTNSIVAGGTVTINGNLTLTAGSTLVDNNVTISLNGNIAGTGTHNASTSGKISMGNAGTISGATLGNLTLNNSGGFSLTGNAAVNGTLTLTSGRLSLGSFNLTLGTATPAVAGSPAAANMIVATGTGELRKLFTANGSYVFPVGDATPAYSPITVTFTAGTYAGGAYTGIKCVNTKPSANTNVTNYLKRYWNLSTSGITSPAYTVTGTYVTGDVTGTESAISSARYAGSLPWLKYSTVNTGTHSISSTSGSATSAIFTGIATANSSVSVSPNDTTVCSGSNVVLTATGSGASSFTYTWSPATGLSATTGASVTATFTGTTAVTYTVTATDGNGFPSTATARVAPLVVPAITGSGTVCAGSATTLANAVAGGTWTSSNTTVATIGSSSGVVTGLLEGTTIITYATPGSCSQTKVVTVNPQPGIGTISSPGNHQVCQGAQDLYTATNPGGVWSTGDTTIAKFNATGTLTGISVGATPISYTITGSNGCSKTRLSGVTVRALPTVPAIGAGSGTICSGSSLTLSESTGTGTHVWSSANPAVATINAATGAVTGISSGTATISYTFTNICTNYAQTVITVNTSTAAITGTASVCAGSTTALSSTTGGGTWSSSNVTKATISGSGVVTGIAAGTSIITYAYVSAYGCNAQSYKIVTVNSFHLLLPSQGCQGFAGTLTLHFRMLQPAEHGAAVTLLSAP